MNEFAGLTIAQQATDVEVAAIVAALTTQAPTAAGARVVRARQGGWQDHRLSLRGTLPPPGPGAWRAALTPHL